MYLAIAITEQIFVLILVCKLLNIKTAYLQHGAITEKSTPLLCDYNFLDGQYTYEKYKKIEKKISYQNTL